MKRFVIAISALALLIAGSRSAPAPAPDNGPCAKALEEAVEVLSKVEGKTVGLPRLWCAVADLRRKLGDKEGATDALRKARNVTEESKRRPFAEWREMARVYGRLGDVKAVTDLASAVPTDSGPRRPSLPDSILRESALAAAEIGLLREAEQIANAHPEPMTRSAIQAAIRSEAILHRARSGDVVGALREAGGLPTVAETVFVLVGQDVLSLAYDDESPRKADGIALVQLVARDKVGAEKTALQALALLPRIEPNRRGAAALAVVRLLARMDDLPGARKALAAMPVMDAKAVPSATVRLQWVALVKAKGYLAAAEVRAGRDEAALTLVRNFQGPGYQAYVLHFIALAQARAGKRSIAATNFDQAVEWVTGDPDEEGTTLHNIASAQALAGDYAQAKRIAMQAGGMTWTNVAHAQALAGDFAGARETAADQPMGGRRRWYAVACQSIAQLEAKAGKAADVKAWVTKEKDRTVQAHALVGLAEGLYREGGRAPGRR